MNYLFPKIAGKGGIYKVKYPFIINSEDSKNLKTYSRYLVEDELTKWRILEHLGYKFHSFIFVREAFPEYDCNFFFKNFNNELLHYYFTKKLYKKIKRQDLISDLTKPKLDILIFDTNYNKYTLYSLLITYFFSKHFSPRIVICSLQGEKYISKLRKFGIFNYKLIVLPEDFINFNIRKYNNFMTNSKIWEQLSETVLTVQYDGYIFKYLPEKYLKYDYIGSPWLNGKVGNGGVSIRKSKVMKEICQKDVILDTENEDEFFSRNIINPVSKEIALSFSSETILSEESVAFHKIYMYHSYNKVYKFYEETINWFEDSSIALTSLSSSTL